MVADPNIQCGPHGQTCDDIFCPNHEAAWIKYLDKGGRKRFWEVGQEARRYSELHKWMLQSSKHVDYLYKQMKEYKA